MKTRWFIIHTKRWAFVFRYPFRSRGAAVRWCAARPGSGLKIVEEIT